MLSGRVQKCLDEGRSVLLSSVDPSGSPAFCRGLAVIWPDDLKTMTAYVPVATSRDIIAAVASTRRVAVSITQPLDHASIQLKGTTTNVRLASEQERVLIDERLEQFADVLAEVGLPRRITRSLTHWPAFAIELNVEEIFEQTPGPKAGDQIR